MHVGTLCGPLETSGICSMIIPTASRHVRDVPTSFLYKAYARGAAPLAFSPTISPLVTKQSMQNQQFGGYDEEFVRGRTPIACTECRKMKRKCTEGDPCERCNKYGLQCNRISISQETSSAGYHQPNASQYYSQTAQTPQAGSSQVSGQQQQYSTGATYQSGQSYYVPASFNTASHGFPSQPPHNQGPDTSELSNALGPGGAAYLGTGNSSGYVPQGQGYENYNQQYVGYGQGGQGGQYDEYTRGRTLIVCTECRKMKRRCSDDTPCERCIKYGLECIKSG